MNDVLIQQVEIILHLTCSNVIQVNTNTSQFQGSFIEAKNSHSQCVYLKRVKDPHSISQNHCGLTAV